MRPRLDVSLSSPFTCTNDHRCKNKHSAFTKKCLDFALVQCGVLCNATSVANCQRGAQSLCGMLAGAQNRLLGEGDDVNPVGSHGRYLTPSPDASCVGSIQLSNALSTGSNLVLVSPEAPFAI